MLPKIFRGTAIKPFDPFEDFFEDFNFPVSFARRMDAPAWGHRERKGMLKMDIKEKDGNYIVDVDLPGCKKEDIELELNDGLLTIRATRNTEVDEKDDKGGYIRQERFSGVCARTINVGDVKVEDIKAKFEDGVLTLTFPKETEQQPAKKLIAIE